MITISLCMIVKNEEDTLARCLDSVLGVVDEIVIADTGSTDRTKEVARTFTDYVYDFEWVDDFSAARNYSYSKASMDYILWLDADDILLPADRIKLLELKNTLDPLVESIMMKYNTGFDSQGNVTFSYYRERLSKRSCNFHWHEPVHEHLDKGLKIINSDVCITHRKIHSTPSERNVRIYEHILSEGRELSARGLYYFARELVNHNRYPDAIRYFNQFLDSEKGWIEDNITACGELARCHGALGDRKMQLESVMRSFQYDTPRAEACCQLGYYFKDLRNYKTARFWFELATTLEKPDSSWGFINHDYWGYIPCIELAVCYDKLGNIPEAVRYNEKAGSYKPDSPAVLYNQKYFDGLK